MPAQWEAPQEIFLCVGFYEGHGLIYNFDGWSPGLHISSPPPIIYLIVSILPQWGHNARSVEDMNQKLLPGRYDRQRPRPPVLPSCGGYIYIYMPSDASLLCRPRLNAASKQPLVPGGTHSPTVPYSPQVHHQRTLSYPLIPDHTSHNHNLDLVPNHGES